MGHKATTKTYQLQIRVSPQEKAAIRRAAKRAGLDMSSWVLRRALPAPQAVFRSLVSQLARQEDRRAYLWAELNDWLEGLTADEFTVATADGPDLPLSSYLANYLAAMVELAAHRKGVGPPEWTQAIDPLDQPVFASALQGLRLHLLISSPPPFRRRNIFIDTSVGGRV